jgi:hypothetical protein
VVVPIKHRITRARMRVGTACLPGALIEIAV